MLYDTVLVEYVQDSISLFWLKIIVGGVASSPQDVRMYASCTLLAASIAAEQLRDEEAETEARNKGAIEACIEWLMDNEFIHIQKEGDGNLYM